MTKVKAIVAYQTSDAILFLDAGAAMGHELALGFLSSDPDMKIADAEKLASSYGDWSTLVPTSQDVIALQEEAAKLQPKDDPIGPSPAVLP